MEKKIDKNVISHLQAYLDMLPHYKNLGPHNKEFSVWNQQVIDYIIANFGNTSDEYIRYDGVKLAWLTDNTPEAQKQAYIDALNKKETALKAIIEEHNRLRVEEIPIEKPEQKEKAQSPIQLFDAMQFHPRIIKVCRKRIDTNNYEDAILRAFVEVNNFVKEKTGSIDDGKSLMTNAFNCKTPLLKLNKLTTQSEIDEQEGFMHLFMGAMQGIRNPKAHENISQRDALRTLEYLALASLLMRRVEEGIIEKPKSPKRHWDLDSYLLDASKRCTPEKIAVMKNLIDFTKANSDVGILWGSGAKYGSFVFQKFINNKATSIFQIYTDGTLFLYFQPCKNKGIPLSLLDSFRVNLNRIPGVNIKEIVINEKDKYGSLSLNVLINSSNLEFFTNAISAFCTDLEGY